MTLAKNEEGVLAEAITIDSALKLMEPPEKEEKKPEEKKNVEQPKADKKTSKAKTKEPASPKDEDPTTPDPKKLTTAVGQDVPEHLISIFSRVNEFKGYVQQLTNMSKKLKKAVADKDPLMQFLNMNALGVAFGDAKRNFKFALPHAVCPYCGADDSQDCEGCKGAGWVNATTWNSCPEDMRK